MRIPSLTLFVALLIVTPSISMANVLMEIDASGSHGFDGDDGDDGQDSKTSRGGNAEDGENAGDGEDSGDINITIQEGKTQTGVVVIRGHYDGKSVKKEVDFGSQGYIFLKARGGDGGDGGDGGTGGEGCDGDPGKDGKPGDAGAAATKTSKGGDGKGGGDATSGTDACDGGDGGDAGEGGDAGTGGDIKLRVSEKDSHLLMLFQYDVAAGQAGTAGDLGEGGEPGQGGRAGIGGAGGEGGAKYTWTTRVKTGRKICVPKNCKMVSKNNGTFGKECEQDCTDEEKVTHHSQEGGEDGARGKDGVAGKDGNRGARGKPALDGDGAEAGSYVMEIEDENGVIHKYTTIWDLQLVSFKYRAPHPITQEKLDAHKVELAKELGKPIEEIKLSDIKIEDGIFEPGETVEVYDIVVRNHNVPGEKVAPTPPTEAMVYLNNNRWVLAEPQKLSITKKIQPGDTYTVPNTLTFKIADTTIHDRNKRFRSSGVIQPLSYLTKVNREYTNFDNPQTFEITYPVEITPLYAPKLMAPGQTTRVFWRVKNLSTQAYGHESLIGRKVQTGLQVGSDPLSQDFLKVSKDGLNFENSFFEDITKLGPNESTLIEGAIQVAPNAPYYSGLKGQINLGLEHISGDGMKDIQFNDFHIRVSRIYEQIENVDLLIVTNESTDSKEMEAWDELAKKLGLKIAVWDLSFYGFIDLGKAIPKIADLRKDFEKKTIVLLNNKFNGQNNQKVRPEELLAKSDFFIALNESLTSMYMLGTSQDTFKNFLIPNLGEQDREFTSLEDFHANLDYSKAHELSYMGYKLRGDYVHRYDVVRNEGENQGSLKDNADEMSSRLHQDYPHKNFMVLYGYAASEPGSSSGLNRVRPGDIFVKRIGGVGVGNAVSLNVSDEELKNPVFIKSPTNVLSIFMAMRFSEKLKYFERLLHGNDERTGKRVESDMDLSLFKSLFSKSSNPETETYMMALVDSMLADLAHEHSVIRMQQHVMDDDYDYFYELFNLGKLTKLKAPELLPNGIPLTNTTLGGQMLVRLAAGIRYLNETQKNSWYTNLFGDSDERAVALTNNLVERFQMVAMGGISPARLSFDVSGKFKNPEKQGTFVWPEEICVSANLEKDWFNSLCSDSSGKNVLDFKNNQHWLLDNENRTFDQLSPEELDLYGYSSVPENYVTKQVIHTNYINDVEALVHLSINYMENNRGCSSLWCEFFNNPYESQGAFELITNPDLDDRRSDLKTSVPTQRVLPVETVLEGKDLEEARERTRRHYQKERERGRGQIIPESGGN